MARPPQPPLVAKQAVIQKSPAAVLREFICAADPKRDQTNCAVAAQQIDHAIRRHVLDLERLTGKRHLDDVGEIIDVIDSAYSLQKLAARINGRNTPALRRALIYSYGPEGGSFLAAVDFDQAKRKIQAAPSP